MSPRGNLSPEWRSARRAHRRFSRGAVRFLCDQQIGQGPAPRYLCPLEHVLQPLEVFMVAFARWLVVLALAGMFRLQQGAHQDATSARPTRRVARCVRASPAESGDLQLEVYADSAVSARSAWRAARWPLAIAPATVPG